MRLPPWYRPRSRPLAETLLTLDFARTTGIGPLEPGLSSMWDMTPILCASDPSHRVRLTVDERGETLSLKRRRKLLATVSLRRDARRIGAPLRAVCPWCRRLCYRLYFWNGQPVCGSCLHVTYASGQGGECQRIATRRQRLEHRLEYAERGKHQIIEQLMRLDGRFVSSLSARLLRLLPPESELTNP